MAEDGKITIEKFNGKDFGWWKMQVEDLLVQKDLDVVMSGERPEKIQPDEWETLDKKAKAVIRLTLSKDVAFNILKEKTAKDIMDALSNMYEKPSAANKVFLIRDLVNTRMKEGSSVTVHINNMNSILSRLESVQIKFEDEVQALLLLSSLPDSWSGTVTAVTSSAGSEKFTFEGIRDLILGEAVRRKNSVESSSDLLNVGRGRGNNRGSRSGNRKRSQSKARNDVTCWNCKEVGHFRNQCPNEKKEVNTTSASVDDSDALICSVESSVDSWVMDSGASFHATHDSETLKNLKVGDFGKVKLANDDILDVTGIGDVDLITLAGNTWTLKDVRVIPSLKRSLISVGQLDDLGHEVKFRNGQWKVVKGNLVVARGHKRGSLYFVSLASEDQNRSVLKKKEVRFTESRGQKKVRFAREKPRANVKIQDEQVRKVKPVRGHCDSGSIGSKLVKASVTASRRQWVVKTKISTDKVSPDDFLLIKESVCSQGFSGSGSSFQWEPVETEDKSGAEIAVTDELKLNGVSTGLQVN